MRMFAYFLLFFRRFCTKFSRNVGFQDRDFMIQFNQIKQIRLEGGQQMNETRRYEIEGLVLNIPLSYDEQAKIYIENYPDFIENPTFTPMGHRVLFSGTDACPLAEEATDGDCPDCGSCRHYRRAGERTWLGICTNEKLKNK